MIGKIAVSAAIFAIDKPYSYRVPEGMSLVPGQRVTVPFGRANKLTEGVVLLLEQGEEEELKLIREILDPEPILTPTQLKLAAFLRERYFCTFYDAIRAILPAGLWFQSRERYALTQDRSWKEATIRKEGAIASLRLIEQLGARPMPRRCRLWAWRKRSCRRPPPIWCEKNGSRRIRSICAGAETKRKRSPCWSPRRRRQGNMPPAAARPRLSKRRCWTLCQILAPSV